ncbi:PREDICTED: protein LONGIFOLIA 2-like isoform X2 [Lupinus angustifolius]|uniref:protein LONGIFOLIA 2-like isoform X2 n=1 Tax=Lupinus angustifolius TaxID=3871 RepID=UPI00092E40C4|nr:PREDICTED: protein LONGIFOLIA 2-like isoform X2 [Lupinus angustifolius]
MSKKVLKTMKDENSDLQKQIGCISGFFQLFDRNRFLTEQSTGCTQSQNRPALGPGGTSDHIKEKNNTMQKAPANNVMVAKEIQQFSTESSGTSISSSSCSSSMSSLEFNRTIQIEQPSIIPIKVAENFNAAAAIKQLDFYDVVKGSMHRESKGLAVKTAAVDEKKRRVLKFIDSPRPLQPHKSVNRPLDSPRLSYDGRDMHDSFKSSTKHKELPRLSLDSRQGSFNGVNEGTKSSNLLKGPNKGYGGTSTMVKQLQESETRKRSSSSSVVAKLMGLEGFVGTTQSSVSPRTTNGSQDSQLQASKGSDSSIKASNPVLSVYGEIEKRMANLEFKNSGKDLRALKQILDAMQRYKDTLDITRDNASNSPCHSRSNSSFSESSKVHSPRIRQKEPTFTTAEKSNPNNVSKSPIVIMKPAKVTRETNNLVNNTNGRLFDKRDGQKSNGMSPKSRHNKDSFSEPFHSADKSNKMRTSKLMQSSKVSQAINGVNTINSSNTAETRSPRIQKKFGFGRRSPSTSPSPDSISNRRQHNRQSMELNSPSTSPRQKFSTLHERNNRFSELRYQRRDFKHEVDIISQDFDIKRSMDSHSDIVVTHVDHSEKSNTTFIHPNSPNLNNATKELSNDSFMAEKIVTAEQPSPVSVLDATFYIEDPPSPVKKKPDISKDLGEALNAYDSSEENSEDLQQIHYNNEKLPNISDIKDPDHKYISEILLVSGLLSSAGYSQAVNSSAHPINPKIFLALEQMKTSKLHFNNPEKMQRKLIFDVVNDILVEKLILESSSTLWSFPNLPTGRKLKGQRLSEEIFAEINQLQHKDRNVSLTNEDEHLTNLLWEDLMHQSTICTETRREIPNVVLDIERLIFKDLITEVVRGEVANYPDRHCRQT